MRLFYFLVMLLSVAVPTPLFAQLPVCDDSLVYFIDHSNPSGLITIRNYDPAQPLSATNPVTNTIALPLHSGALAISKNINNPSAPSPTFYTTRFHTFYYYDGANWVNTGHSDGGLIGGGLASSGPYIYIVFNDGEIYRYDGTGNAVHVLTIPDWFGPAGPAGGGMHGSLDVAGDCEGNFYVLRSESDDPWFRKYSPTGVLLQQWGLTGMYASSGILGGPNSLAKIGNRIYFDRSGGCFVGVIGATDVACSALSSALSDLTLDFASCMEGDAQQPNQTIVKCTEDASVTLTARGVAPFSYALVSGTATVAGSGPLFTVTASTVSVIALQSAGNGGCQSTINDTFTIVPPLVIDAGPDLTISGCSPFIDTLHGTIGNGTTGLNYAYSWTPASVILSGPNTPDPVISPVTNTTFHFSVTLPPEQGGCIFTDSVRVTIDETEFEALLNLEGDQGICPGAVLLLKAEPEIPGAHHQWYHNGIPLPGATGSAITVDAEGRYVLFTTRDNCSDSSKAVNVVFNPVPDAGIDFKGDVPCLFDTVAFSSRTAAAQYQWEPATIFSLDADISNRTGSAILRKDRSTIYLTIFNEFGCTDTDSLQVNAKACCSVFTPSAFSPNADGLNDHFRPELSPGQALVTLRIFDRWGKLVYDYDQNRNVKGWDGKYSNGRSAEGGTYMYYLQYTCADKLYDRKEDLSLIR